MKKVFSAVLLAAVFIILPANGQAETNFDLNRDFNSKLVPVSTIYSGRVVGISTYLSLREGPSEYSAEIMRIPNGAELVLRDVGLYWSGWWQVVSVSFNGQTYREPPRSGCLGYVSTRYVSTR